MALMPKSIGGHHGVAGHALNLNAVVTQGGYVVVEVVPALGDFGVFQQGLYRGEGLFQRKLLALLVADGHVPGLSGGGGEAETYEVRRHGVYAGGFSVKGELACFMQGFNHLV